MYMLKERITRIEVALFVLLLVINLPNKTGKLLLKKSILIAYGDYR